VVLGRVHLGPVELAAPRSLQEVEICLRRRLASAGGGGMSFLHGDI
jgi:hypothetical protein